MVEKPCHAKLAAQLDLTAAVCFGGIAVGSAGRADIFGATLAGERPSAGVKERAGAANGAKEFRPEAIVQLAPAGWAVAQDFRLLNKLDTLPAPDQLAYFRDQGVVFLPPQGRRAGKPYKGCFPLPSQPTLTLAAGSQPAAVSVASGRPAQFNLGRPQPVEPFLHGGKNLNDLGEDVASYQRVAKSSPRVNSGSCAVKRLMVVPSWACLMTPRFPLQLDDDSAAAVGAAFGHVVVGGPGGLGRRRDHD
jgi:hypothetical protein